MIQQAKRAAGRDASTVMKYWYPEIVKQGVEQRIKQIVGPKKASTN